MSSYTCVISNIHLQGMCPISRCPANVDVLLKDIPDGSSKDDIINNLNGLHCLYAVQNEQIPYKIESLVPAYKKRLAEETNNLTELLQDIKYITAEADNSHCCQNCGYIEPCKTNSICKERKALGRAILTRMNRQPILKTLKPSHLWLAVYRGRDKFLSGKARKALLNLFSNKLS